MQPLVSEFDVDAAADRLRRVLETVDEYDRWHPDVEMTGGRRRWTIPLALGRRLPARVVRRTGTDGEIRVRLFVAGVPVVEHRFTLRPAGRAHTVVRHEERVRAMLVPLVDRRRLAVRHDSLAFRLRNRGEWINEAPDTRLRPRRAAIA